MTKKQKREGTNTKERMREERGERKNEKMRKVRRSRKVDEKKKGENGSQRGKTKVKVRQATGPTSQNEGVQGEGMKASREG